MNDRTLLVVSARVDGAAREAVAAGRWPRKDFLELQAALNADVVDYGSVASSGGRRLLSRVLGVPAMQAWAAFAQRRAYDRMITDGEHVGIPLALLLRLSRRRVRHVTIGHLLSTRSKRWVFRRLRPQRRIDAIALHATLQRRIATTELDIPAASTHLVPYGVDSRFWFSAGGPDTEPLICAAGLEYRDYPTLIEAARGLPVRLVIAAGSRWSRHRDRSVRDRLPANVSMTSLDYAALRDLYRRARFVVVPLRQVENQAGVTTILEAMSMSRAVVVSATRGQRDAVRGRMVTAGGIGPELCGGPGGIGVRGPAAAAETGLYVPPGDPAALRRAIRYLLEHPTEAERMGRAGRRVVEEAMNLDQFVRSLAALATDEGRAGADDGVRRDASFVALPSTPGGA